MIRLSNPMRLRSTRINPALVRLARGVVVLSLGLLIPTLALAETASREVIDARIAYYAKTYGLPEELLRKVVRSESTFNPLARNGPYWGLMQIRHNTAQGLGYRGPASGLLDAETNLIYGGAYLANAYLIAGGNSAKAHNLYRSGYYYEAKRKRLLSKLIKVPMGTTPVLVAGKLVTQPSDTTLLALATPEPTSPVPAPESSAKASSGRLVLAEGAQPGAGVAAPDTDVETALVATAASVAPMPIPRPVSTAVVTPVAAPVVEMAAIVQPLLPRPRPVTSAKAAAPAEPAAPVRGLLYATAILPPSKVIRPDYAEQTIAQPELALASASSGFANSATALAFATATPVRVSSAHKLPSAVRLASTQNDAPPAAAALPLPRARPAHTLD